MSKGRIRRKPNSNVPLVPRTAPSGAARVLIQALEQIDGDIEGALSKARLLDQWPEILSNHQQDIPRNSFAILAQECVLACHLQACRRDSLPPLPPRNFRLMCTALLACPTLGVAIEVASDFQEIALGGVNRLEWHVKGGIFTLSLNAQVRGRQVGDMLVSMFGLAAFHRLLGWLAWTHIPLTQVQLSFPQVPEQAAFNELFQLQPEFDCPVNSISFPVHFLQRPIARKYDELADLFALFPFDIHPPDFEEQSLAERSRQAIAAALTRQEYIPSLERLANMFGLSTSSYRRRMSEEGASLIEIRRACRKDLAAKLLSKSSLTVSEIAYKLQFADVATFRRAFRQWMGCSPRQYRISARSG